MGKIFKFSIIILIGIFFIPIISSAHRGGTDAYGCHTCHTNCPSYGLSYEEYHCHQSTGLTQPESPIRSHYGESGTGWTEPWPDYSSNNYSHPTIPTCPLFSSYNSLSKSCECDSGYVADGYGGCESGNSFCHRKIGYNSSYKTYNGTCKCDYDYILDNSNKCVSRDDYCQNLLGWDAEYKILNDVCGCKSGYILNSSQTSCINGDNYCTNNYGWDSYYDSYNKECKCENGYEFRGNQCVKIKIPEPVIVPTFQSLPKPITPINNPPIQKNKVENSEIKKDVIKKDSNNNQKTSDSKVKASSSKELVAPIAFTKENSVQKEKKFSSKFIWNKIKSLYTKLLKK